MPNRRKKTNKGAVAEEVLRSYFIRAGYFAVRAVPFAYEAYDLTDVDIWLYMRSSSVSRTRAIVDIKSKKTPQAMERIFWTKGLQSVLGVDQAVVATTDRRIEVSEFGKRHGVVVLDGAFLNKLTKGEPILSSDRMSEEDLLEAIDQNNLGKLDGDWKGRFRKCKALLLSELTYDQLNAWLEEANFFAKQTLLVATHREVACRIFYFVLSLIAICVDFIMRDLAFVEQSKKQDQISDGVRFGASGDKRITQSVDLALNLLKQHLPAGAMNEAFLKRSVEKDFESIPASILAEYFSKPRVAARLYETALNLEAMTYSRKFVPPNNQDINTKGLIGVVLDFWNIDREKFFASFE
ncbi:MAG: hypothetical protein HOK82_10540 [Rhodospirillaceae bacterium]|jgi:hypothetical protein|nr:hypothetical protein [Rhodospirillaceae bacterium]